MFLGPRRLPRWLQHGILAASAHCGGILEQLAGNMADKMATCRQLGRTWAELGRSWEGLRRSWGSLGRSWGSLGRSCGGVWGALGRIWGVMGRSWGHLGPVLAPSWAILGPSWAILSDLEAKRRYTQKPSKTYGKIMFLGSRRLPRWLQNGMLAPSWDQEGPSWAQDGPRSGEDGEDG